MYDWAELRHFRYLLTILEKQGFRVAAEELHTSQPNLTVQARQFQEYASIRLFRRMKNGRIRPTGTGTAFVGLARLLLETRDEVMEALIAIERGDIASVRFGCAPFVDRDLFGKFCAIHREILPACRIRPTHGDTSQLAEEVAAGMVDAALVTLPLNHPNLYVEELCHDRLVVCLRRDNPLANKAALQTADLQGNLTILYHPNRHPDAHQRLLELLADTGVRVEEYSRASHPSEMQILVKEGHGLTLMREGTPLEEGLTTRPVAGVDWTVDTAVICHREHCPKTIPILIRKLRKQINHIGKRQGYAASSSNVPTPMTTQKRPSQTVTDFPIQLELLDERTRDRAS